MTLYKPANMKVSPGPIVAPCGQQTMDRATFYRYLTEAEREDLLMWALHALEHAIDHPCDDDNLAMGKAVLRRVRELAGQFIKIDVDESINTVFDEWEVS